MKKLFSLVAIAMAMLVAVPQVNAQSSLLDVAKERKELNKLNKKELTARAAKPARKEAKRLAKEGWTIAAGKLPLEKQLERSYLMQLEYDESQYPVYIMTEAISVGETYNAAKNQSIEVAKLNLAGLIESKITNLVENTLANDQISPEEAASVSKTVSASKQMIAKSLGRILTVTECHRTLPNKNVEILVHVAYNQRMAMDQAKAMLREELKKEGQDLHEELDKMWEQALGF